MSRVSNKNARKPKHSVADRADRIVRKTPSSRTRVEALRVAASDTKRDTPVSKRTRPADSAASSPNPKSKLKTAVAERSTVKASQPVGLDVVLAEMAAAAEQNTIGIQVAHVAKENCIIPNSRLPETAAGPWSPMIMLVRQQTFAVSIMFDLIRTQQEWFWRSARLPIGTGSRGSTIPATRPEGVT